MSDLLDPGAVRRTPQFDIILPNTETDSVSQDEEWCTVTSPSGTRRVRFHDYDEIFATPGLYEQIFYDTLKCNSPETVCGMLEGEVTAASGSRLTDLEVLEIGPGNGMVGERLRQMGVRRVVGVDIIEEAAEAAQRDRPGIYDDYLVTDLTEPDPDSRETLESADFNCLVSVAALGFGDLPPRAFAEGHNLIEDDGWLAFNIKDDFTTSEDPTGFAALLRESEREGVIDIREQTTYRHRFSVTGEELHYVAYVAQKRADIPEGLLESVS